MIQQVKFRPTLLALVLALGCAATRSWASGSGLNVAVVVNRNDTNSVQLGNYYCEQRQVPPQNLVRINWTGGNVEWSKTQFESTLLTPLTAMLASRGLSNQVDFVVLSMGIPYRVANVGLPPIGGRNSTTSTLFYGFKPDDDLPPSLPDSCSLPASSANPYAGSELPFRSVTNGNAWLTMMITSSNLAQAKAIVDRGVASDGSFPTQKVILGNNQGDPFRNIRYTLFDDAIFSTRLRGNYSMVRDTSGQPYGLGLMLGYENGMQQFSISPNTFVPGAMADSLTSYGGMIFESPDHTLLLAFLDAGATASFGTVVEPCGYLQKFPLPQGYFYQARGFGIAESYYQSLMNPHQGLLLGEPLAAPFAQPAAGSWVNLPANAALGATTNLSLQFTSPTPDRPVQQVDLFIDGAYVRTLTNIPPRQGNIVYVTLNGAPTNYIAPAGATLQSVVSNLVLRLNTPDYTNTTKVSATAYGDRIELQSFDFATLGAQIPLLTSNAIGGASALTTGIAASGTNLLDSVACGIRMGYVITNAPLIGDYLQMIVVKTNGQTITVSVTNSVGGTNLSQFAKAFFDSVNTNPALQTLDGVAIGNINMHEDWARYGVYPTNDHSGTFDIRTRGGGWAASKVQVAVTGSPTLSIEPSGTNTLDTNQTDLQPRAHLYITAGVTNLPLTFAVNTTTLDDGFHQLTAVAYEGSHVRTQKRVSQIVRITNSPLAATFATLVGGSNTLVTTTLQFAVTPNTNTISRIELFSTGGLLAGVTNQPSATFSVAGADLDLGLHPFCALVTRNDGKQYRTATTWIRLVAVDFAEPPFTLTATAPPPVLSWPATVGRTYQVLSATNVADVFQLRATLVATNSPTVWAETNLTEAARFYRVRALP